LPLFPITRRRFRSSACLAACYRGTGSRLRPPRKPNSILRGHEALHIRWYGTSCRALKAQTANQLYVWRRREDLGIDFITPGGERIALIAAPSDIRELRHRIGNDMPAIQRA